MNDCYDISILPNYNEHCWLNTILMCVLYSQYSRDMLINISIHWKDDIFLNIIRNIINSYYSNKKNVDIFYHSIIPAKLLYEIILDASSSKKGSNNLKSLKWTEYNIIDFYRFLGVNCVDVIYYNDRYLLNYLSKKPYSDSEPPEVVILFHQDLTNIAKNYSKHHPSGSGSSSSNRFILDAKKAGSIATYGDEIEFMGTTYILSSCIVNNNDEGYRYHSTAGLICNGKKVVYNSYINKGNNPCSLINYDWDVRRNHEMCLNPNECELSFKYNIKRVKDLCFSFGSGNRYLIYIQKSKTDTSIINLKRDEIQEPKPEPIIRDIIDEIMKVKELSMIGLYYEIEKSTNTPININNIKPDSNRDELEKYVLEYRLKSLPEIKEVIPDKIPTPIPPVIENEGEPSEPQQLPQPPPEINEEPKEEITGGMLKKLTKKELISSISKKLNNMKKNKLISLYTKLKSNN